MLNRIIDFTPFHGMRQEDPFEDTLQSLFLLRKKNYCSLDSTGKFSSKGISQSQKYRLGVCGILNPLVLERAITKDFVVKRGTVLGKMMKAALSQALSPRPQMALVSKEIQREGVRCLIAKDTSGTM